MCGVLYFCLIIIIAIRFSSTLSPENSGLCGIPSSPFGAVPLPKEIYNEGEEVNFKCVNDYIDFKQTKKCVKGRWVKEEPDGREPLCGPEDKFKSDIIRGSVASISYKEGSISIRNSEILKSGDNKIGNYVLLHSETKFLGSAKGFEVTFQTALTHIIYLLRMAFVTNNNDIRNIITVSLNVSNNRKCELIEKRELIPSKWSELTTEGNPVIGWFICKAIDQNNFNEESKVISATIDSKIEISVNWISFHLIGHYRIGTQPPYIPDCGIPDHPIGFEIKPNEQNQRVISCAEGFSQDNQNGNKQVIKCDYKMEWSKISIECIPKKPCEQLEQKIGLKNLRGVVSMKKGYYSPSKYFAITGTEALIMCDNKTASKTYTKTIVCGANGEWNGYCIEDKKEETTKPTISSTIPTNATEIPTNATEIPTNATEISTNATEIPTNATEILTNATTIPTNATTIPTSATEIPTNATTIPTSATTILTTEIKYTTISYKTSSPTSDYSTSTMSLRHSTSFTQTIINNTTKNGLKCKYKGEYLGVGNWPEVDAGNNSSVACPQGNGFSAVWKCMNDGKFDESGPDWSACYKWLDDLPPQIENYESALIELDTISDYTGEDNSIINYDRSAQVMKRLEIYQNFTKRVHNNGFKEAKKYASKTINVLSNLLNQKFMWSNTTAAQRAELGSILLKSLQYVAFDLGSKQTNPSETGRIKSENIYSETFFTDKKKELVFPVDFDEKNASIIIPEGLTPKDMNSSETNISAGAVIYKLSEYLGGTDEYKEVFSPILSFSLTYEIGIVELNKPIKIKFKHNRRQIFGEEIDCVYWDFNNSSWSSEGCYKVDDESDLFTTVCKCDHLCNLAALMDTSGREDNNDRIKSKLTYIFCGISIVCLIFSIISTCEWCKPEGKESSSERAGKDKTLKSLIIRNLSISLLGVNLIVVSAISSSNIKMSEGLCQISSGLLLCLLLSSFCWMLLEGYQMFKKIQSHFDKDINHKVCYGIGYVLPIVLVVAGLIITYVTENIFMGALYDERYNQFCWISSIKYPYHIWLLIGPFLAVMALNACFVIYLLRKALCSGNHFNYRLGQELMAKDRRLVSYMILFCILGGTWLSFILYVNRVYHFFSYLFIVLNGSQGLYIFAYNYFMNIRCNKN